MLAALVIILFLLLFLGLPIIMPLSFSGFYLLLTELKQVNPIFFIQQSIGAIEEYVLLCIPLFILTAEIMNRGESADRLVDMVKAFIGHINGGLAITTSVACTLFGAISGSTQATVAAIGTPMRRKMLDLGYEDDRILALIINSSDIAILIPPSSVMILYSVITGASVAELFISGIGPGILICILFSLYNYIIARVKGLPKEPRIGWNKRLKAVKAALPSLGIPVIVLGGIFSGTFSPVEAAAVSVVYALILEVLIFKKLKLRNLGQVALSTGTVTAVVFCLIAVGGGFSSMLAYSGIPQELTRAALGTDPSAIRILVTVCIFFFVGCMFVDSLVVMMIVTPIFLPFAKAAGIDLVFMGVLITLQAGIGTATPPFGCDIFTAIAVFNKPYFEVIRKTPPYIVLLLFVAVLLLIFPEICLGLRDLVFR